MTLNSRGHRRACDQRPIVIKRDPLVCDRDDDLERTLLCVLRLSVLRQFRFCVPVLVLVPGRSAIAPPRPVLGPKRELGMCDAYRKYENGKCCHYRRADGSHIDVSGDRWRHGSLTALFSRIVVLAVERALLQPGHLSRDGSRNYLPSGRQEYRFLKPRGLFMAPPAPDLRCTCRRSQ